MKAHGCSFQKPEKKDLGLAVFGVGLRLLDRGETVCGATIAFCSMPDHWRGFCLSVGDTLNRNKSGRSLPPLFKFGTAGASPLPDLFYPELVLLCTEYHFKMAACALRLSKCQR